MRVDREEQVALLTCSKEHHSFLLDSSDHWDDVVQDGKPREKRCRCGSREYDVELGYELRDDGDVRTVALELHCASCGRQVTATTFEIDYAPTDALLSQPLEPCEEPWLIAKRTEVTGLWVREDLQVLVRYLAESENALCYYAGFKERPSLATLPAINAAVAKQQVFHLYFSKREIEFPANLNDCWKRLPVIHASSPTNMIYKTGPALLYYVRWADQFIVDRRIVPQEPELLTLADRLLTWLRAHFSSARGKRAFDNRAEYERLKGGW